MMYEKISTFISQLPREYQVPVLRIAPGDLVSDLGWLEDICSAEEVMA